MERVILTIVSGMMEWYFDDASYLFPNEAYASDRRCAARHIGTFSTQTKLECYFL